VTRPHLYQVLSLETPAKMDHALDRNQLLRVTVTLIGSLSASTGTAVSVATLEIGPLDKATAEAFFSVCRRWSVTLRLKRVALVLVVRV